MLCSHGVNWRPSAGFDQREPQAVRVDDGKDARAEALLNRLDGCAVSLQPRAPELQTSDWHLEPHLDRHAVAEPRRRHMAPGEKRQIGTRPTLRIRIEQVIGARIVLVHALLDQAHAEDTGIEVEVFLRRPGDGGYVMKAVDSAHDNPRDHPKVAKPDRPANDTDRSIKT